MTATQNHRFERQQWRQEGVKEGVSSTGGTGPPGGADHAGMGWQQAKGPSTTVVLTLKQGELGRQFGKEVRVMAIKVSVPTKV